MSNQKIVIIDYTLGNLFSVKCAFEKVGFEATITDNREDIINAHKIVLPGVGAFKTGMDGLKSKGLVEVLQNEVQKGKSLMSICLGMQMLMTTSEEDGEWDGLDLVKGSVKRFASPKEGDLFKIPHYGWTEVTPPSRKGNDSPAGWENTILQGVENSRPYFYFVHSYYVSTDNPDDTLGESTYGHNTYTSVLCRENISGCQFHPERSGPAGLQIIANFAKSMD